MTKSLSLVSKLKLYVVLLLAPFRVIPSLITLPLAKISHRNTWRRRAVEAIFKFVTNNLSNEQLQHISPPTLDSYRVWCRTNKLPVLIESIGENADLMWVEPKRTDRVLLLCHGGGYMMPLGDYAISFCNHIRTENQKRGLEFGVAILHYGLMPHAVFPTQLRQAVAAIQNLQSQGVQTRNIQLIGDSGGANLALSILSHAMHPLDTVPRLELATPLGGACLLSPYLTMTGNNTWAEGEHTDVITPATARLHGALFLRHVPEHQRAYVEAVDASKEWFSSLDQVVTRVLLTAGDRECFKNDVERMAEKLQDVHSDVQLEVQEDGVHVDPYADFIARSSDLGPLTPKIVDWVGNGFR